MVKPYDPLQFKLNSILMSLVGSEHLVDVWWDSPNRAFGMASPAAFWAVGDEERNAVKDYILSQASGDYL